MAFKQKLYNKILQKPLYGWVLALISLVSAGVFVTICSKNSFLYPMNDWGDANCFFTVGKAISNGMVLYRDIFEQKGPILYFLYALAYKISPSSFFGAYVIELFSFAAFLFVAGRCIGLYINNKLAVLASVPLLSFSVCISVSFYHGGSVEELTLFCLAFGIYAFLQTVRKGNVNALLYVVCGICIGYVLWIKYTLLGLFIGGLVYIGYLFIKDKKYKQLVKMLSFTALGVCIASVPVFAYFSANDSISYLWQGYFYNNIFVYSHKRFFLAKLALVAAYTAATLALNIPYSLLAVLGGGWAVRRRNAEKRLVIYMLMFTPLGIYYGGVNYKYYGLPLAVFALFGIVCLFQWAKKYLPPERKKLLKRLTAAALVLMPLLAYLLGHNTYLMKYEKEDMPQYKFAAIINKVEDATLLNYGFLDGGFYFAADVLPTCKYFCKLNFKSEEMTGETESCILESKVDFVVTRDKRLEESFGKDINYTCVEEATHYFQGANHKYYLYKRNE